MTPFLHDEGGATAIEYGLIAGLIACAIIFGMLAVGAALNNTFTAWSTAVNGAVGSSSS